MRLLILDDDAVFAQVLARKVLAELGHKARIHQVETGEAALEYCVQEPTVDVLLVDLKLAEDSGLRWIAALRQQCPQARIVVMTAFASIATTVDAIKLGADDYLPKPFSLAQLLEAIGEVTVDAASEPAANDDQRMSLKRLEWEHIQRVLDEHDGNVSAAARELGLHRRTLQRKLQKKPHN